MKPQRISSHVTLQAPLSRRGRGPGLVLVLDHYAEIGPSEKYLDPPPLQKWAEEGFAVVQVCCFRNIGISLWCDKEEGQAGFDVDMDAKNSLASGSRQ